MTPRRLTEQQARRIAARQREALTGIEGPGTVQAGLVIARFGRKALIETDTGERHSCHQRANLEPLIAGDRVSWTPAGESGVVIARQERRNALHRPDSRGQLRPVAANIDLMLVVVAAVPAPHANLIDRYLVAAHHANIRAALVLNKQDLLPRDSDLPDLISTYEQLGYATAITGADDPQAASLQSLIRGKTLVLVGQSGVGKSSLLQRLVPDQNIRIGELSETVGKGRHTTTTAELFHLPGGGSLIDSPGIREFHLHHLPAAEVAAGFSEFRPMLGHCRFRDCSHRHEDGCAIRSAVVEGVISKQRYASFINILDAQTGG